MIEQLILDMVLGFGIGLLLGLLGGGGSILTVPLLVYVVGQSPQAAVTTSLAIVGANSAFGAFAHRTQGTLRWQIAVLFGGTGMIFAYAAAGIAKQFSPDLLMVAFSLLMLVIGGILATRRTAQQPTTQLKIPLWKILVSGAGVGLLTGVLGVGGGFLIVPALVMLLGLPMHHAIGTSLLIIAMNSLAGFLGHLQGIALDISLILFFVSAGLVGTLVGARLGRVLNSDHLRRVFAVFIIGLALVLLYDNLPKML